MIKTVPYVEAVKIKPPIWTSDERWCSCLVCGRFTGIAMVKLCGRIDCQNIYWEKESDE
jgi:hypothetical protein